MRSALNSWGGWLHLKFLMTKKQRIRQEFLEQCNVHTIVRLPNSVFQPYASVATNLLFFTKGEPTRDIWYWEHKLPEGQKSYSKTKPIRKSEFEPLKAWWNSRVENEHVWKVNIETLKNNSYNLDIKNPFIKGRRSNAHHGGIAGAAAPVIYKKRYAVSGVEGRAAIGALPE